MSIFFQSDDEFVNTISNSSMISRGPNYWPIIGAVLFGICAFAVWAHQTEIEQITTGQGRVIPSSQIQVVQTLEGGLLREIAVREGDLVEKGQLIARIDDTSFSSELGKLQQKRGALLAERVRLLAEAQQANQLAFPVSEEMISQAAMDAELELFSARKKQIYAELQLLNYRLQQREFELVELGAQEHKLNTTLAPLKKEAEMTVAITERGIVPEVEYLRLQSRVAEMEGDLEIVRAAKPKVEASIHEAKEAIVSTAQNYVLSARQRLTELEAELAIVQESMRAASDRVSRTNLTAPVRGIVNRINITTVGAVVQPGIDLVEIVPIDDGLLIEARIRPQDVAFLKPDALASVKLTAYDYLIYGDLEGTVSRISADTLLDERGDQFYQVIVRTHENSLPSASQSLPIIPGMTARVDIKTGTNTVLSFLFKPILRARFESLRER